MRTKAGRPYATLANDVSKAIADAVNAGMDIEEAASVTAQVAADYWRGMAGLCIQHLAEIIVARDGMSLPVDETEDLQPERHLNS